MISVSQAKRVVSHLTLRQVQRRNGIAMEPTRARIWCFVILTQPQLLVFV